MTSIRTWICVAVAAASAAAQVNQNVWVASVTAVYEVSPTGALVGTYGGGCFGPISPCQNRTARDQFGNVYMASLTYYAPGVGGALRKFQTGMGVTNLLGGGISGVAVDAAGDLWWAQVNYSAQAGWVINSTIHHGPLPFIGTTHSVTIPGVNTLVEPHPVSGAWVTDGQTVFRMHAVPGGAVNASPSLSLPSLTAIAADGLGRLWAYQWSTGQLLRIVEGAGGLAVDWNYPLPAGFERIVIDRSNQVMVHVITPGGLSSLVRFGADGTPLPVTTYPVQLRTIDVDTHGGLWGQHLGLTSGIGLLHQDAAGVIGATVLNTTVSTQESFTTHGDTTGSIFARLGPPGLDSDGDGSQNRNEVVRGTDPFSSLSRPPLVTIVPVPGSSPQAYTIGFLDLDSTHWGFGYVLGCALSATTGIEAGPYGMRPTVPLDPDFLLTVSLTSGPPTFVNFSGVIPAGGGASGLLALPPGTPPGVVVHVAGATLSPGGPCVASSNAAFLITP